MRATTGIVRPAFAWYSDAYAARYPDEHLECSFVNARFKRHKRYVDSYGWTDYDNAVMKGDCREVIARGRPFPRE